MIENCPENYHILFYYQIILDFWNSMKINVVFDITRYITFIKWDLPVASAAWKKYVDRFNIMPTMSITYGYYDLQSLFSLCINHIEDFPLLNLKDLYLLRFHHRSFICFCVFYIIFIWLFSQWCFINLAIWILIVKVSLNWEKAWSTPSCRLFWSIGEKQFFSISERKNKSNLWWVNLSGDKGLFST